MCAHAPLLHSDEENKVKYGNSLHAKLLASKYTLKGDLHNSSGKQPWHTESCCTWTFYDRGAKEK